MLRLPLLELPQGPPDQWKNRQSPSTRQSASGSIRTNHFGLVAHFQSTELPRGNHPTAAGWYRVGHFHEKPNAAVLVIILGTAGERNILLADRQRPGGHALAGGRRRRLPRRSALTLSAKESDGLLRRGDIGAQRHAKRLEPTDLRRR